MIRIILVGNIRSKTAAKKSAQKLYGKNGEKLLAFIPVRVESAVENGICMKKRGV